MVEAKGKIRRRHQEGIVSYLKWLERNPRASLERRISQFDAIMDSALLQQKLRHEVKRIERVG